MMAQLITRQISRRVEKFRKIATDPLPAKGWIHAIRGALGMTLEQLGAKMNIPYQSVQNLERTEVHGSPTLKSLKAVAEALNCQLVYAFVPQKPLEKLIEAQAEKKAREIIEQVGHTMALENQSISKKEMEIHIKNLKEELLRGNLNQLWNNTKPESKE